MAGCGSPKPIHQESFVFGTRVEVVALGASEAEAQAALAEVLREFDRLHSRYHAWQPSELTTLNKALAAEEAREVDDEMLDLLRRAKDFAARGNYLFDPAIGKLIQIWGFHTDTYVPRLPDKDELQKILATRPSITDVEIQGHRVSSRNPSVEIDLGGIAKGYALDRAREILLRRGIRNALINIGGNVMALGNKAGQPWVIGIQHPRRAGAMATLALYDGEAIGTSGDYQRFFEVGGTRYCHLLDPRTGSPVHHTEAVSVLVTPQAGAGILSDVASKPIFLGAENWREMASRMGVSHVLRVSADGKIAVTEALRARLRWADDVKPDQVIP